MIAWLEAIGFWLADFYLVATGLLLLAAAGARWLRQPVERLELCRAVTFGLAAVALLTIVPGWQRWRPQPVEDFVARSVTSAASPPMAAALAPSDSTINHAAAEAAKLEEAFAAIDALLGTAAVGPEEAPPQLSRSEQGATAVSAVRNGASLPHGSQSRGTRAAAPEAAALTARAAPSDAPSALMSWPFWCGGGFALGSGCAGVWLLLGAAQTAWLRWRSSEAPPEFQSLLRAVVGDAKLPRLGLSGELAQPVALGLLRPGVLLPRWLAHALPAEDLRAVLAHEWAHIRRGDLLLLALSRGLLLLLFAHPLFWWLRGRVRLDQELVADASAAGDDATIDYAERLLQWTRLAGKRRGAVAALALGDRPSQLQERIHALLDPDFRVAVRCPRRCRLGAWGGAGLAAVVLSLVTLRPPAPMAQAATVETVELASAILPMAEYPPADLVVEPLPAADAWAPPQEKPLDSGSEATVEGSPTDIDPFASPAAPRFRGRRGRSVGCHIRLEGELEEGRFTERHSTYTVEGGDAEGLTLPHFGAMFPTRVWPEDWPPPVRFGPPWRRAPFSDFGFHGPAGGFPRLDPQGKMAPLGGGWPLPFRTGDVWHGRPH